MREIINGKKKTWHTWRILRSLKKLLFIFGKYLENYRIENAFLTVSWRLVKMTVYLVFYAVKSTFFIIGYLTSFKFQDFYEH